MRLTGTARRLLAAFGLLLALFGVAAFVAARGLARVGDTLTEVRQEEERVRNVLQLANTLRDQYAHQAHTILLENTSHLPMYEGSRARVLALARELAARPGAEDADADIRAIARASDHLDEVFYSEILPAVRAGDRPGARAAHDEALTTVLTAQAQADALAQRFEGAIADFEEEAARVQVRTYRWAVALFLSGLLFAAILGLYVGQSVGRPVAALEAGARRLAEGDLDTRIHLPRSDEFGRLARQFNEMTDSLQRHQAELVRSERLAGIGRLAAGVAHEINNPLGVILGYVRLLRKRVECGSVADDLKVIDDETVRAKEIVEGLLDLSRPWDVGAERVALRDLAERAVDRVQEAGMAEGVRIEVLGEAEVQANPRALMQVLVNLTRNAAEAAGPGGRVRVRAWEEEGRSGLTVEDDGPGLPEEVRDRLFEPFFTTKAQGTGLGLAVSRAIAGAHGGHLEAEDTGAGARFTLSLPHPPPARTA